MSDLLRNPASTGIATGSALGAFVGGLVAFLTGRDERIERWAARGSLAGGGVAAAIALADMIIRLISPNRAVR